MCGDFVKHVEETCLSGWDVEGFFLDSSTGVSGSLVVGSSMLIGGITAHCVVGCGCCHEQVVFSVGGVGSPKCGAHELVRVRWSLGKGYRSGRDMVC